MKEARAAAATGEATDGPPREAASAGGGGDRLDRPHGCTVARFTSGVRAGEDSGDPLLPLAGRRCVRPRLGGAADGGGCGRRPGLASARRGQHRGSGAPACGRGTGGDPAADALGRSRGGFSTKRHVRTDGSGKPMVLLLSPGERHESRYLSALLEQGAVRRCGRGRPVFAPLRWSVTAGIALRTCARICVGVAAGQSCPRGGTSDPCGRSTRQRTAPATGWRAASAA